MKKGVRVSLHASASQIIQFEDATRVIIQRRHMTWCNCVRPKSFHCTWCTQWHIRARARADEIPRHIEESMARAVGIFIAAQTPILPATRLSVTSVRLSATNKTNHLRCTTCNRLTIIIVAVLSPKSAVIQRAPLFACWQALAKTSSGLEKHLWKYRRWLVSKAHRYLPRLRRRAIYLLGRFFVSNASMCVCVCA